MNSNKNIFSAKHFYNAFGLSTNEILREAKYAERLRLANEIAASEAIAVQKDGEYTASCPNQFKKNICNTKMAAYNTYRMLADNIRNTNTPLISALDLQITALNAAIYQDQQNINAGQQVIITAGQNQANSVVATQSAAAKAAAEAAKLKAESVSKIKKMGLIIGGASVLLLILGFIIKAIKKGKSDGK